MHLQKPKSNWTKLALAFEGAITFIQKIRVSVRRGGDGETSWKAERPCFNEFVKP
jgi:hypothetical protein